MKVAKIIGGVVGGFLVLILLALIAALFVSKDLNYEKSITINAPIETVWEHTNSLTDLNSWGPWSSYDSEMKVTLTGVDGTVGAKSSWESDHEKVGKGSQTISKIEAPNLLETDLHFIVPFESEAKGYVKLHEEGTGTIVTWGFASEMPYPMNLMMVMMDMEEGIGEDFGTGLNNLKNLCE